MTPYDAHDQMLRDLGRLQSLTPDPARASRVRAQCRTRLARNQRRAQHRVPNTGLWRRVLAPVVVLGLCALYMASLISTALHVR